MRNFLILLLSVLLTTIAFADEFVVKSFKADPSDVSARVHAKKDVNGDHCAIIKVRTGLKNLKFHSNQLSDLEQKTGEYWLYVSPGIRYLEIMKEGFAKKGYEIPRNVKSQNVYIMQLTDKSSLSITSQKKGEVTVNIRPKEAKAKFKIDGMPKSEGLSGFSGTVAAGEWLFKFLPKSKYYKAKNKLFKIKPDTTTNINVELEDISGYLNLDINTKPVNVYINGEYDKELTENNKKRLLNGKYKIVVKKQGDDSKYYKPFRKEVVIKKHGNVTELPVKLTDISGYLQINTEPKSARVYFNNEYDKILSTGKNKRIISNSYDVSITKTHYMNFDTTIKIEKGEEYVINKVLTPKTGSISINSTPKNAPIYIDGELKGKTNLYISDIIEGRKNIKIKKDGFWTFTDNIYIHHNGKRTINTDLKEIEYKVPRSKAAIKSLIIPGMGQIYSDRIIGGVYGSAIFVGILHYLGVQKDYKDQEIKYKEALNRYESSTSNLEGIRSLWEEVKYTHNKLDEINQRRQICLGVIASIWIWNVIDSYIFVPKAKEKQSEFSIDLYRRRREMKVELSYSF